MMDAAELEKLEQVAHRADGIDEEFTPPLQYVITLDLKRRINRVLTWASADRSRLAGIASLVGLARVAVRELVDQLEADHNGGEPFPYVPPQARKRGPQLPRPNTLISLVWPVSLYDRIRAAVEWQSTVGESPQRTSSNIMVGQALEGYVTQIEQRHPEILNIELQQAHHRPPGRPSHR